MADFAVMYDNAVSLYGKVGSTTDRSESLKKIADDFDTGKYTDDNILYIASSLSPVVGTSEITTKAIDDKNDPDLIIKSLAGQLHTKEQKSLAFDIGTFQQGLPIVTTENEQLFVKGSVGYTSGAVYFRE